MWKAFLTAAAASAAQFFTFASAPAAGVTPGIQGFQAQPPGVGEGGPEGIAVRRTVAAASIAAADIFITRIAGWFRLAALAAASTGRRFDRLLAAAASIIFHGINSFWGLYKQPRNGRQNLGLKVHICKLFRLDFDTGFIGYSYEVVPI